MSGEQRIGNGRMQWSRKLTPAQVRVVAERYYAGGNVRQILKEFNICRSSLYRYLNDYNDHTENAHDPTYWRIEYERIKNLVVELARENQSLRAQVTSATSQH